MRPLFPPVIETERAQRCWHRTNNKWTQGLNSRKYQSLFDVSGAGLFCRLVKQPDGKIREWRGEGQRERGIRGLQTKHLHIRVKPAEPPVHNKLVIQYQEKGHSEEQKSRSSSTESHTLYSSTLAAKVSVHLTLPPDNNNNWISTTSYGLHHQMKFVQL